MGKNNVRTALSLVGYERHLDAAMKFVFGDSFVCPNMESAKKVTYDHSIMKKSVTFDGDSFNPGGTLTGGKHLGTQARHLTLQCCNRKERWRTVLATKNLPHWHGSCTP